ncbi:thiolase family protein [Myxococcota bacterium]|nr:thiolase family protein [Myxococcota bacterium]
MLPGNRRVFVVGYAQSPFGKLGPMTIEEAIRTAAREAAAAAGVPLEEVGTASVAGLLAPLLQDQTLLSGLLAMEPALAGKPIETVENACASGGQAVLTVLRRLLLGEADVGLAVGIEKMRDDEGKADGKLLGKVLGTASHLDERPGKVFVFPHLFAEVQAAYMAHWGVTEEQLAHVPVTFYAHGNHNPLAQMQKVQMTVQKVMTIEGPNRYIAEGLPLKTFECSQMSDGWAGLVLATEDGMKRLGIPASRAVELAGFGQATDPLSTRGRDVLHPAGAYRAMQAAYRMAGIGPADVGVAEVHDCFGIMGALAVEILGLAEPGQGARYYVEGHARVGGGKVPINTSGGLIAKGHPIGATGVAMIGWNYWQLLGRTPEPLRVPGARYAATFNIGGPICASVTTVLKAP